MCFIIWSVLSCWVSSVVSDSVRPRRWQPTRLHHPWDSPGNNTGVGCHFLLQCMKVKSESEATQWCPILSDPMDCSLPGCSVHGIFQARTLEWAAIAFSEIKMVVWIQLFFFKSIVSLNYFFFKTFRNFCEKVVYTRQLMTTDSISSTKGKRKKKNIYSWKLTLRSVWILVLNKKVLRQETWLCLLGGLLSARFGL